MDKQPETINDTMQWPRHVAINPFTADPVKDLHFCHTGLTCHFKFFWHSGTLALSPECQSARMSEIKNGGLDQYGAEPFEWQHLKKLALKGLKHLWNTVSVGTFARTSCSHRLKCKRCTVNNFSSRSSVFYRAAACNATHCIAIAILSVWTSVCPSVRCVYFDKTKSWTADNLIPHKTAITLVFWRQQWLVDDAPFSVKYSPKVAHPLRKMPTSQPKQTHALQGVWHITTADNCTMNFLGVGTAHHTDHSRTVSLR